MKNPSRLLLVCALVTVSLAETAVAGWRDVLPGRASRHVQYFGARRYTQKIAPQTQPPPRPATAPAAPTKPPPANPAAVSPVPPPLPGAAPATDSEKAKEEKDAVLKRTIEFQKKRAEAGSASAQYDLGKRYLTGDGLAQDLDAARKWFEAAAKQDHEGASAKLEELKKIEQAAPAKK